MVGQHISTLLGETEDADAVCALITVVFDEQRTFVRELQFQCMDPTNSHAHCEMASHLYPLLDEQGRVHSCVIANTDLTARRDAEIHRFELALEQERVKVLERFIGDMSHDLRTPLTKLSTALYLLERMDDAGKRDHYIEMLRDQIDHMDRMFVDMLQVLRIDRPHDHDFGRRDMNSLVSTVVEGLQLRAAQKRQRLAYNCDETLPPIWADEGSLRVAFGKIIENALAFTPADGAIICRTRCREQEIIVEVVDTGEGVDPADIPHIFEHFYRGDPARGTITGRAGLGLALAKKIVEGHQGHIEVESEPGVGSTFRICLPAIAERDEQD
jgi:signal transduction histidine kinase